jgi:hypothetical protein
VATEEHREDHILKSRTTGGAVERVARAGSASPKVPGGTAGWQSVVVPNSDHLYVDPVAYHGGPASGTD